MSLIFVSYNMRYVILIDFVACFLIIKQHIFFVGFSRCTSELAKLAKLNLTEEIKLLRNSLQKYKTEQNEKVCFNVLVLVLYKSHAIVCMFSYCVEKRNAFSLNISRFRSEKCYTQIIKFMFYFY